MLRVENLRKSYGGKAAVDDLSFQVPAGRIVGLLGPNGAGKTSTLRIIMGLLEANSGAVLYRDAAVGDPQRDQFGYLPEDRGLYLDQRVYDVLHYLAVIKGVSRNQARVDIVRLLDRLDLVDVADQRIRSLSRGSQQKVQIIAALAHNPELLILDEPFSGLDPLNQAAIRELLIAQKGAGKAILLSSHQMDLVESICDDIYLLHEGRLVLSGPLEEVRENHSGGFVTISARGDLSFLADDKAIDFLDYLRDGARIRLRSDADFNASLQRLAKQTELNKIERRSATLQDVFLQTIKKAAAQ
jgi:ABC-2 type transport system ATP-binding protein